MVIWLLSVCLAVAVVAYVRVRYPRRTTRKPQIKNLISTSISRKDSREGDMDSTQPEGSDTRANEPASSEPHKAGQPQASTVGSEDAKEVRTTLGGTTGAAMLGNENCTKEKEARSHGQRPSPPLAGRGGQPRVDSKSIETGQTREGKGGLHTPRPEIVCWKRDWEWVLGVEVSDELAAGREVSISQSGTPLVEDTLERGCWPLRAINGDVIVRFGGGTGEPLPKITLGENNYLIFRLSSDDKGCRVKQASSGSYLVVISEDWQRNNNVAGTASVEPEPVCLKGYLAHFFDLSGEPGAKIGFRDSSGHKLPVSSRGPRFHLEGDDICDASEKVGPLFGGSSPHICISDGSWEDVGAMVIGEEGGGKGKWRTSFDPKPNAAKQELPIEIVNRKAGWYFVRFYNLQDELIDSLDFRFVAGLRRITIRDVSPFPPAEGHRQAIIDFHHERDCQVEPIEPCIGDLKIERQTEKTTVIIPASQEFDRSRWLVGDAGGPQVRITVLLKRVWWALGDEHQSDLAWQDQCLLCQRDDFRATSNKTITMRLPQRRWAESVRVGFSETTARSCLVRVQDSTLSIPLREFGDSPATRMLGVFRLVLYADLTHPPQEIPLCMFTANAGCKFDTFSTTSLEELFSHIGSLHLSEFFRPLTYHEMREREPRLPVEIYVCGHCDCYVSTSDGLNPTDKILAHIDKHCRVVRDQKLQGASKYVFHVVEDVDEIRKEVVRNLPHIQKCKLCSCEFKDADQTALLAHLRKQHENSCFELR